MSLGLVDYSSDDGSSNETQEDNFTIEEWVQDLVLNKIVTNVVNICEEIKQEDLSFEEDRKPSFDVYRAKQRLMSECSSVIINGDDQDALSSSPDDTSSDEDEADSDNLDDKSKLRVLKKPPKVKGELDCSDLPPIADLTITVPQEKCFLIGLIKSCVGNLVVVESFKGVPAIDLDSVLFLERGSKTLGQIFDVFGRVDHPCYCVRFNSATHIQTRSITPGQEVYYAPETEHTIFIFVEQLKKLKGSDASWKHNHEAPSENFSDDESEVIANAKRAQKRSQKNLRKENCFYNSPQQQAPSSSFYRSARRHRPQDYGPIQWNSRHVSNYNPATPIVPDFSRPPPGMYPPPSASNMPPPPNYYYPSVSSQWFQPPSHPPGYRPFYYPGQSTPNPFLNLFRPPPPPQNPPGS